MRERYDPKYEARILELAENRLRTKNYRVFDGDARVARSAKLPELKREGKTSMEDCLVVINREGEAMVLTVEFQLILLNVLQNRF